MSRWNKLKGVPNRTSPMISVEQQFSNELLSNMSDETGKPPQIDGYPTVLANSSKGNRNVGVQVSTSSDEALTNLVTVTNGNSNMNVENSNNSNNAMNNENNMNTNENNVNVNNINENNINVNGNNNMNGSFAASNSSESINNNTSASTRPSTSLSAAVRKAVKSASNESVKETKRLRGKADEELSFPSSGFASPPSPEKSTMTAGAGAPSGLCRLSGGSNQPTLYSMLKGLTMQQQPLAMDIIAPTKRTQRKRTKNRK